jgi:hypothetical protein
MSPISRGFRGRRPLVDGARVPPGQHVVDEFPVLSVGSTPHMPLDAWTFGITGAIDEPVSWKWEGLRALPAETPTVDRHTRRARGASSRSGAEVVDDYAHHPTGRPGGIHCVTAWSRDAVVPSRSPEVQVVLLRIDDDHGMANSTSELK